MARVMTLAAAADERLAELEERLRAAVDAARRGNARIISGEEDPGPELVSAADEAAAAGENADAARAAVVGLRGTLRATRSGPGPALPPDTVELDSIANQLRETAPAAAEFAAMRRRSETAIQALEAALARLDAGDLDGTVAALAPAHEALVALATWESGLVTLPIWLETTTRLVDAVEQLALAIQAGDLNAAEAAELEFIGASEDGREADIALRLAIAEGGGAVTAAAAGRLVDALRVVTDARAIVASILHPARR